MLYLITIGFILISIMVQEHMGLSRLNIILSDIGLILSAFLINGDAYNFSIWLSELLQIPGKTLFLIIGVLYIVFNIFAVTRLFIEVHRLHYI